MFFEGFRRLRRRFGQLAETGDPRADLVEVLVTFRGFAADHPELADVMFSRPFADFGPGPDKRAPAPRCASSSSPGSSAASTRACWRDATDIAHVLLAVGQGLAGQETAGWLGTSRSSVDRRWALAVGAVLDGLRPAVAAP